MEIVGGSGSIPGQRNFSAGQSARIVAHTNAGWRFTGWSGDASGGSAQTNVTMNGDKAVTAHWERVQPSTYTLTVSANPSGGSAGYVEIVGGSGNTPGQRDFASGQSARIVAHTNAGWRFTGWSGDAGGSGSQTNVTINRDKTVIANWERVQPSTYTLRLEATPNDGSGGYVEAHNGSGNTPGQRIFDAGEYANLQARPNSGWRFVRWELDAGGSNTRASVLMNRDKRVRAVFEQVQASTYTLTVASSPSSAGQVLIHNGSGNTPGQRIFNTGDVAQLEAVAWSGWCFWRWTTSWNSWTGTLPSVSLNIGGPGSGTMTAHFYGC